jgi:hypothetical protein
LGKATKAEKFIEKVQKERGGYKKPHGSAAMQAHGGKKVPGRVACRRAAKGCGACRGETNDRREAT